MMDAIGEWIERNPLTAGLLSAVCLMDALNCVRLGHIDWIIPTFAALWLAVQIKPA